mmetsp:Transcript_91123/g.162201  ORF Transcript_91123/g.162201 Transcript_91123/m.162201 type:complete len:415 (+) Transcript_91123:62-1306(+)
MVYFQRRLALHLLSLHVLLACKTDFAISVIEPPSMIIGYPTETEFQQSQNPSYVHRSPLLPDGGLMVRLQNCSSPGYGPNNHSSCAYHVGGPGGCSGISGAMPHPHLPGDRIAFIPFSKGYTGDKPPRDLERITPKHVVPGPAPGLADELWGTQDPQCSYDNSSGQYFLSYTAWSGPDDGWGQKAAISKSPSVSASWRRLGEVFNASQSWPNTPSRTGRPNIKCGALYASDGHRDVPHRYYLYSGDVETNGARVSFGNSLFGPWSKRQLILPARPGFWDEHVGCFTPPVILKSTGDLLVFYNAFPASYPGPPGFQVGWAVLNASDPTKVIHRGEEPVLSTKGVKWMEGTDPAMFCNNPYVVFMQSPPQPVLGQSDVFRLYFGMGGSYVGTAKVKVDARIQRCDRMQLVNDSVVV